MSPMKVIFCFALIVACVFAEELQQKFAAPAEPIKDARLQETGLGQQIDPSAPADRVKKAIPGYYGYPYSAYSAAYPYSYSYPYAYNSYPYAYSAYPYSYNAYPYYKTAYPSYYPYF